MKKPSEPAAASASTPSESAQAPVDPAAIQAAPPFPSTGIQTQAPPTNMERVALPPITPEQRAAEDTARKEKVELRMDRTLVMLVLGLAFLSASFPIRN